MQPDITTTLGLQDHAILEMFYSTGLRRMECANLELFDVDRVRGTIFIRLGHTDESGPADQPGDALH